MSGEIIQEIRKNKGLSQAYVLDSLMTQSAYSKFERGQTEIRASIFTNLLMRLDMRLEEFTYIQNGYKQSTREHIIQRYFTMQYNNKTVLQDVLNLAQDYLQTNTERIRVNVFINIGYLFMKNQQFEEALVELDLAATLCKAEKTYLQLAICHIRKGICLNQLHAQGQDFIEKGKQLLYLFEEEQLLEILEGEIIQFSYTE